MDPRNPRNNEAGNAAEYSEKDGLRGVYVYQPKNAADEPVGEKKFLEAREPAHAEAFLRVGYRQATEEEEKEYRKKVEASKVEARKEQVKAAEERGDVVASKDKPVEASQSEESKAKDAKKETK